MVTAMLREGHGNLHSQSAKAIQSLVAQIDFVVPCRCPYSSRARTRAPGSKNSSPNESRSRDRGCGSSTVTLSGWTTAPLPWNSLQTTFPWSSTDCLVDLSPWRMNVLGEHEAVNGPFTTNNGSCCLDELCCHRGGVRV